MAKLNKEAYNAVIKARTVLLVSNPFFGTLALHLQLVEITDPAKLGGCETMAVDGIRMYYWPEFVLSLKEQELVAVVAHEVMHCALSHMTRRGHRHPTVWNWAGDYRINWDLKEAGFTLPGVEHAWKDTKNIGKKGHLLDKQFANMSSEEIYERLKQDATFVEVVMGSGGGEGKGFGDMGQVLDAGKPGDPATSEKVQRDWEATVRLAVNVAQRNNAGQLPGYLKRLIDQLEQPRVNWRDKTRQFIDSTSNKDFSWARPNRRFVSSGLYLPGTVSDNLHRLVFVVDVSGSVSNDMMRAMASEAAGALDEGITDHLTIMYADDGVRRVDEFEAGDQVTVETLGGGGTDFRDSFKWIKANASDASAVIYLTDMMTTSFGEDPGIPTLWAAFLPREQLARIHPPFGDIVEVDTE